MKRTESTSSAQVLKKTGPEVSFWRYRLVITIGNLDARVGRPKPSTAASHTPLWLASGWECRSRHPSRA
jgi:hypothetical protein